MLLPLFFAVNTDISIISLLIQLKYAISQFGFNCKKASQAAHHKTTLMVEGEANTVTLRIEFED